MNGKRLFAYALGIIVLTVPLGLFADPKDKDPPGDTSVARRLALLEDQVLELGQETAWLRDRVVELSLWNRDLAKKVACVSAASSEEAFILEGCNVHVRNGEGATNSINGFGNLIVGYDAPRDKGSDKTGSHNVVVGDKHNYSRYGGLVVGLQNTISGDWSSVSGGFDNTASGIVSCVSAGQGNNATHPFTSVSGGWANWASDRHASVSGGVANRAFGEASSISGGENNEARHLGSSILGSAGQVTTFEGQTIPALP
jgi:hypothetical protein